MIDETGKKYGRLTVVELAGIDPKRGTQWLCSCECGMSVLVYGNKLRNGRTKSCGCLKREVCANLGTANAERSSERMKVFNKTPEHIEQARAVATKHGGTGTRLFRIWEHMRERCNREKGDHAKWYHEKGIRVCEEWEKDFSAFKAWAESSGYIEQPKDTPYKDKLSIDRIDPEKGYSPSNCRWISVAENSRLRNQYHANQR